MAGDNWERVQEIFLAAVNLPEDEWPAFLDRACVANPELRAEVESLLQADTVPTVPWSAVIRSEAGAILQEAPVPDARLGAYRILKEIGRGGMGTVYLAERADDQYKKMAAIKLVKRGMDTAEILSRFRHERQILANLDHPYIARLYDGGATPDGRPYFVMEYVEGQPISIFCRHRNLDISARLRLFVRVCEAVSYAHRNLVIHRDLKPGNILVTADGIPKLLDFGVAKLLDPRSEPGLTATLLTGGPLITAEYASPEQVLLTPATTTSDVYSLGAVLYEMITGTRARNFTTRTPSEIERVVCHTEVPRPSASVPKLDGDLDNIVLMAMRREPDRRYQSVDQLAEDIQRHLDGLPVIARRDSLTYRASKFFRRHRLAVLAAGIVFTSLVVGVTVSLVEAHRAEVARRLAERRLSQMVELADRSLYDVHSAIEHLPGSTEARRRIVATTLQFLADLSKDAGSDDELRYALSSAYSKVGDVLGRPLLPNLGDTAGALVNYEKAIQLIDPLVKRQPDNPRFLLQKVAAETRRAALLAHLDQDMRALEIYRANIPAAKRLGRLNPKDVESRLQEPQIYAGAVGALTSYDESAAQAYSRLGIALLEQLRKEFPANTEVKLDLAGAHSQSGQLFIGMARLDEAVLHLRRSIALREGIVAQNPADATARRGLMISYATLADTLGSPYLHNTGDLAGARAYYARVVAIAEDLARADPNNRLAQMDLAHALSRSAMIEPPETERARSLARLQQSAAILERLLASDPKSLPATRQLALVEEYMGHRLRELGRPQAAESQFRRSLERVEPLLRASLIDRSLTAQALADEEAMAEVLASQGNRAGALAMASRAIKQAERWPAPESERDAAVNYIATAYSTNAQVEEIFGDCRTALVAAQKAISGWQKIEATHGGLINKTARDRAERVVKRCGAP